MVTLFEAQNSPLHLLIPLISEGISAGFPSPALDFTDVKIDLNELLIKRPSSTFFGRVSGDSMKNAGIFDGDLIVIDKSIKPGDGMVAVCVIDGELTLKRLCLKDKRCFLKPENEAYPEIEITEDTNLIIWGIVTNSIHTQVKTAG
ncbi:MAG: translesion error-prone DNA polymerase V autoproteolytic subunit [Sediminibacterium sp.]|nr:translesion error-prone DNA polymerase V autoproteolytic subunit [Sediminibacterium sp.]